RLFAHGPKRRISTDHRSMVCSPFNIHSARYLPAPPAEAMPTELKPARTKRFRNSGASPIRKLLSGVKLSGPFTNLANLAVRSAGIRCLPLANGSANLSQSGSSNSNENLSGTRSTIHGLEKF